MTIAHARRGTSIIFASVLWIALAVWIAGCSTTTTASTVATLTMGQSVVQSAINLYGIAKGFAVAAELADPAIAPALVAAIAIADPIVAQAQVALTDAATDVATLETLAAQITAQANALTLAAAPPVKVVPATAIVIVPAK